MKRSVYFRNRSITRGRGGGASGTVGPRFFVAAGLAAAESNRRLPAWHPLTEAGYAPAWYVRACVGFDLVIAAWIAFRPEGKAGR